MIAVVAAALSATACKTTVQKPQGVDYQMEYTIGDVTFDMVKIPAGHYTMGLSADNRRKVTNGIPHEVALDGFVISAKPVSQALWTAVMGDNPSSVQNPVLGRCRQVHRQIEQGHRQDIHSSDRGSVGICSENAEWE